MIGSGVYLEKDRDGKDVGFQFGMLASMYTEQISGKTIYAIFKEIEQMSVNAIVHYFYGAMAAYEFYHGGQKITVAQAAETLDKFDMPTLLKIYSQSIQTPVIKNGQAPKEGQKAEV